MRSDAIPRVHTTDRRAVWPYGTFRRWPGTIVAPSRPFALLQLPHARARIPAVARRRDRPERLPRLHRVHARSRPGARVPREHGPDQHCDEHDDDDSTEHVFAL